AVHVRGHHDAVTVGDGNGAVVVDVVEQLAKGVGGGGADLDPGVTGVVLPLTDADVLDDVGAASGEDLVEYLGQDQRVDDVALELDFLDEGVRGWRAGGHAWSPCWSLPWGAGGHCTSMTARPSGAVNRGRRSG